MKDFGEWFSNPCRRQPSPPPVQKQPTELEKAIDLVEAYLSEIDAIVTYRVVCRACGERFDMDEMPTGQDSYYCGGSIHCTP